MLQSYYTLVVDPAASVFCAVTWFRCSDDGVAIARARYIYGEEIGTTTEFLTFSVLDNFDKNEFGLAAFLPHERTAAH